MSPTREKLRGPLRRVPLNGRSLGGRGAAEGQLAREQFARTFADVLSGRFGGRWDVEWEGSDRPPLPAPRNRRTFAGEE